MHQGNQNEKILSDLLKEELNIVWIAFNLKTCKQLSQAKVLGSLMQDGKREIRFNFIFDFFIVSQIYWQRISTVSLLKLFYRNKGFIYWKDGD